MGTRRTHFHRSIAAYKCQKLSWFVLVPNPYPAYQQWLELSLGYPNRAFYHLLIQRLFWWVKQWCDKITTPNSFKSLRIAPIAAIRLKIYCFWFSIWTKDLCTFSKAVTWPFLQWNLSSYFRESQCEDSASYWGFILIKNPWLEKWPPIGVLTHWQT